MTTHSSILAWKIPWKGEPGRLQSMGSQRVGHGLVTDHTSLSLHVEPDSQKSAGIPILSSASPDVGRI